MPAITPIGTRLTKPTLPSPAELASRGMSSPPSVRATAAEKLKVSTARAASTRAVLMGLAASAEMTAANSSTRSASGPAGLVEDRRPLVGGQRPAVVQRLGDGDGPVEVALVALGHRGDQRAVEGGVDLDALVGGDSLVADDHRDLVGHLTSSCG